MVRSRSGWKEVSGRIRTGLRPTRSGPASRLDRRHYRGTTKRQVILKRVEQGVSRGGMERGARVEGSLRSGSGWVMNR